MSRRAFRMAAILRIRQAQEKQAAGSLARANALLSEARAGVVSTQRSFAEHTITGDDANAFLASVAARAALNVAAQDALIEQELAGRQVDEAGAAWRDAKRTVRSLEHLETKHAQQQREAAFKREQRTLDDVAGRADASGGKHEGDQ